MLSILLELVFERAMLVCDNSSLVKLAMCTVHHFYFADLPYSRKGYEQNMLHIAHNYLVG